MNFDDPRITAYALGELESAEDRAAVEALLRENPEAAAEVEETRSMAKFLKSELKTDTGEPLTKEQRAHVLAVAAGAEPVNGAVTKSRPPGGKIVVGPWRRPVWISSAVAALVVVSTGIGLLRYHSDPVAGSSGDSHPRTPLQRAVGNIAEQKLAAEASESHGNAGGLLTHAPLKLEMAQAEESPAAAVLQAPQVQGASPQGMSNEQIRTLSLAATDPISPSAPPADGSEASGRAADLLQQAERFKETGRYDLALKRVHQTLSVDPQNVDARKLQLEINQQRQEYADGGYNHTRSYMTWQANTAWDRPVRMFASTTSTTSVGFPVDAAAPQPGIAAGRSFARGGALPLEQSEPSNTESYDSLTDNAFKAAKDDPLSTFSIDVDTASYANVRRFLTNNQRPPKGAVRIEELVNYFPYAYQPPAPEGGEPFSTAMEVAPAPWAPQHRLVRIALKGREMAKDKLPPSNLVFLIDVSGSMSPGNKLPLVKESLLQLVNELREQDTVGIVVYAGSSGVVLEPTSDKAAIREALERLRAGGSTNGASGIQAAYDLAQRAFKKEGNNRVVLATDGDFNVGVTSQSELVDLIERKAKTGVFLSVLGFGMGNTKDSTMEKLADKGNGNYAYVDSLREARKVLVEEMSGTLFTIAKDVKIQVEFNPATVGAYRLIGYENRVLAKEDFNDDKKDAGEIGAGHTVTALYEVVPAGLPLPVKSSVDPLKYQPVAPEVTLQTAPLPPQVRPNEPLRGDFGGRYYLLENQPTSTSTPSGAPVITTITKSDISSELLTLKLRYKQPDSDTSTLKEFPLTDSQAKLEDSSADLRWAAAVASFGMILRDSPHRGNATWDSVATLARGAMGEDRGGYRAEFLTLVERARQIVSVTPLSSGLPETAPKLPLVTDSKAAMLILPQFDLNEQPVLDAIDALSRKSKELDEEKVGVAIVYAGPSAGAQKKVTLQMRNISVLEAARMIASAAGLQLEEKGPTLVLRAP